MTKQTFPNKIDINHLLWYHPLKRHADVPFCVHMCDVQAMVIYLGLIKTTMQLDLCVYMPSKENLIGWYHLQGTIANRIKPGNCSCKTKGSTVINCVQGEMQKLTFCLITKIYHKMVTHTWNRGTYQSICIQFN